MYILYEFIYKYTDFINCELIKCYLFWMQALQVDIKTQEIGGKVCKYSSKPEYDDFPTKILEVCLSADGPLLVLPYWRIMLKRPAIVDYIHIEFAAEEGESCCIKIVSNSLYIVERLKFIE